jgi:hypothetical protein
MGAELPVSSISNEGVIISNEEDTWPCGLVLEFDGDNPVTRYRMDRIRRINGWGHWEYKLNLHVESGRLVVTGGRSDAMPDGSYWFRLRIADFQVSSTRYSFALPANGEATVAPSGGLDVLRESLLA